MFQIQTETHDLGHRVIDVNHFTSQLVQLSQHESLFNCGLASLKLVSEHRIGLQSEFTFVCSMCNYKNKIKSSLADVNKDAVAGIMAAGCGQAHLKQFSAAIGLPIMSDYTYNKMQDEVCNDWEETAWDEMKIAGEKEKEAAINEGRVTKDGTPMIDVIVDGCWSKRSYRTNYAALSGAAAIIGRRFGQVLYMCVKNKYCCICARAQNKKETPREHVCYKNFDGASTAMESQIISEGFKQSIEMHGLIYARLIADGDSSTYAKIINARPYPGITVSKIYCRNHLLRNYCNKLHQLTSDTHFNVTDRKYLTQQKILRSRKYVCDAIKLHKESQNTNGLYEDINTSIDHAFNSHEKCNQLLCKKHLQVDAPNPFFGSLLWQKIKTYVAQLAEKAHSLIEDVDSNVVERFNGVIAKLVGGKRVNYSQRRAYQARCSGAVISFNTGNLLSTVHRNVYGNSPKRSITKHEKAVNEKRNKTKQNCNRKKKRSMVPRTLNLDYGEIVDKPDLDEDTLKMAKDTFIQNLMKTEEQRKEVEKRTILQSESGEWLELRRSMLTASNFGKIVKRKETNTCQNTVKNLLYKPNIQNVSSISHGRKYEKIAIEQLSVMENVKIEKCGLFIDEKYPFLGATPDGITNDNRLVEVKCPITPFKMGIDEAIQRNKMHFYKKNKNKEIVVNKKSDWYFQVQGQLHICKKQQALLGIWYGNNKIKTEVIEKDDAFWSDVMEPKLLKFYYDCLLPELVDPRHIRNRPIRDPKPVIAKDKENEISTVSKEINNIEVDDGSVLDYVMSFVEY